MWSDPLYTDVLYIPDDIVAAFAAEAREQVEASRAAPRRAQEAAVLAPEETPTPAPAPRVTSTRRRWHATRARRVVATVVVWVALIALGIATSVWTVHSFYSTATQWTLLSFGGGAAWVVGTAVALSYRFPPLPK